MKDKLTASLLAVMAQPSLSGLECLETAQSVEDTAAALEAAAAAAGARVAARLMSGTGPAKGAGPATATLLIVTCSGPEVALRVRIRGDEAGNSWISYDAAAGILGASAATRRPVPAAAPPARATQLRAAG